MGPQQQGKQTTTSTTIAAVSAPQQQQQHDAVPSSSSFIEMTNVVTPPPRRRPPSTSSWDSSRSDQLFVLKQIRKDLYPKQKIAAAKDLAREAKLLARLQHLYNNNNS